MLTGCGGARTIRAKYSPKATDYPVSADAINAYHFIDELFEQLAPDDIVVCGDATATIVPFQIGRLKLGMRLFSNSGSASMGYDLPAAIGAAIARPDARVICLAGDGSIMMNMQELQTLRALGANVKVLVLDNGGYLSIKQTQWNFFGREFGASPDSGVTFPNFRPNWRSVRLVGRRAHSRRLAPANSGKCSLATALSSAACRSTANRSFSRGSSRGWSMA